MVKQLDLNRCARGLALVFVVLGLAACSSAVKLSEPAPVVDAVAKEVQAPKQGGSDTKPAPLPPAQPSSAPQRSVATVNTDPAAAAGGVTQPPASLARVVYFDYDSYEIRPEFQAALDAHAKFLKANGKIKVGVEGHTDERGGREYNLALGQRRSEAVARALRVMGVPDAQSEAVSFGKEKPAASGNTEAVWAKNRRVELFYK